MGTWKTQFAQNDTFYFNGIDCTSETHCCAVGESMDLPFDGAGIWCTHDGETWNRTFYSQDSNIGGFSLIDSVLPTRTWAGLSAASSVNWHPRPTLLRPAMVASPGIPMRTSSGATTVSALRLSTRRWPTLPLTTR